jgi:hypothetical protein
LKASHHIVVSSAEIIGAFSTDFDTVNLHHPTTLSSRRRSIQLASVLGRRDFQICSSTRISNMEKSMNWKNAAVEKALNSVSTMMPAVRGLHSSTYQLEVSTFWAIRRVISVFVSDKNSSG